MRILALLLSVLFLYGCGQFRTDETQNSYKNQNTEKLKDINETYDVNLMIGAYPVTGQFTRTVSEHSSSESNENAEQKKTAVTKLEMPPEFKALMSVMTKLAANFAAPGLGSAIGAGETFMSRLSSTLTSDAGIATIATGATGVGTLGVIYRNRVRRRRDELVKEKEEETDEMLRQIVKGLERFLRDGGVAQDCKDLLMTELSKSLDKSTKDWLLELGFKVA